MSVVLRPVHAPDLGPVPLPRPRTRPRPPEAGGRRAGGASGGPPDTIRAQHHGGGRGPDGPGPIGGAPAQTIRVVAWPDPVIDRLGYDPRSLYVETFWLGILGPTSTWLLRRLAARFDDEPAGFDVDMEDAARALGLGARSGRHAPLRRALARCITFEVARRQGPATLAVRRKLAPLPRRHLQRLPASLQAEHTRWLTAARRSPVLDDARRRSRRLAVGLLESGETGPAAEAQLVRWQVHPALAHEATQWAGALRSRGLAGDSPDPAPAP